MDTNQLTPTQTEALRFALLAGLNAIADAYSGVSVPKHKSRHEVVHQLSPRYRELHEMLHELDEMITAINAA